MNRQWNRAITVSTALCLSVIATANAQEQTARDSIPAFYAAWTAATASEGPAGFVRFFAPTARLIPPGGTPIVGRDSIRGWFERTQREATTTTQIESTDRDDITIAGPYALVVTITRGQRVPRDGSGSPMPFETRYVDVLERTTTGWQVNYRTWNDKPPGS